MGEWYKVIRPTPDTHPCWFCEMGWGAIGERINPETGELEQKFDSCDETCEIIHPKEKE